MYIQIEDQQLFREVSLSKISPQTERKVFNFLNYKKITYWYMVTFRLLDDVASMPRINTTIPPREIRFSGWSIREYMMV